MSILSQLLHPTPQLLSLYLRGHLVGASVGLRLAQHLAADPWTSGALKDLPAELSEEFDFVRRWARTLTPLGDTAVGLSVVATGLSSAMLRPLAPFQLRATRPVALETMRTMVLAKKAMWEAGLALSDERVVSAHLHQQLADFDKRALRQVATLHEFHVRASVELFSPDSLDSSPRFPKIAGKKQ